MSVEDGIPEGGQATPTHDWEKDYKALQAEYTRSQQALKDQEGLWDDDEALATRLREARPTWFEEDEEETAAPEYEEGDPVAPLRSDLDEVKQWKAQVEAERAEARFTRDLKAELGDSTIPEKATDWIQARTASLGNNPKALKQAVEEYQAIAEELRGPVRKSTPTPPAPGKAADIDPNTLKDPNARRAARRAKIAAQVEAGMQQQ